MDTSQVSPSWQVSSISTHIGIFNLHKNYDARILQTCCIVSDTSIFICKIHVLVISTVCPCHVHAVSGHHSIRFWLSQLGALIHNVGMMHQRAFEHSNTFIRPSINYTKGLKSPGINFGLLPSLARSNFLHGNLCITGCPRFVICVTFFKLFLPYVYVAVMLLRLQIISLLLDHLYIREI